MLDDNGKTICQCMVLPEMDDLILVIVVIGDGLENLTPIVAGGHHATVRLALLKRSKQEGGIAPWSRPD